MANTEQQVVKPERERTEQEREFSDSRISTSIYVGRRTRVDVNPGSAVPFLTLSGPHGTAYLYTEDRDAIERIRAACDVAIQILNDREPARG